MKTIIVSLRFIAADNENAENLANSIAQRVDEYGDYPALVNVRTQIRSPIPAEREEYGFLED